MKTKIIPTKNYVIAFFIVVISIIITLLLCNHYMDKKEYEDSQNIRMNFLDKIDVSNIDTYLVENHDKMIYLSNSEDTELEEYEKQLKKMIITMEYEKDIVYFDIKNVNEQFYSDFKNKYFSDDLKNINFDIFPNLIIVENGVVTDILYKEKKDLRASDLIRFVNRKMVNE